MVPARPLLVCEVARAVHLPHAVLHIKFSLRGGGAAVASPAEERFHLEDRRAVTHAVIAQRAAGATQHRAAVHQPPARAHARRLRQPDIRPPLVEGRQQRLDAVAGPALPPSPGASGARSGLGGGRHARRNAGSPPAQHTLYPACGVHAAGCTHLAATETVRPSAVRTNTCILRVPRFVVPRLPTKPLTQRRRLAAAWAWERKLARLLAGMDKLLSRASALVGLGPACTPTITFSDEAQRKKINVIKEGQAESLLVFTDKDPVAGEVTLKLEPGKRLEHLGVKIEFIGMIEMFYGNYHEFSNLVRDLDAPGELVASKTYPFDFSSVDKQYDSYNGINVKLRYLLRVTVTRQYRYVCPSSSSGRAAGASVREAVRAGKPPRAHQTE
jgi:hypothetical protein